MCIRCIGWEMVSSFMQLEELAGVVKRMYQVIIRLVVLK